MDEGVMLWRLYNGELICSDENSGRGVEVLTDKLNPTRERTVVLNTTSRESPLRDLFEFLSLPFQKKNA